MSKDRSQRRLAVAEAQGTPAPDGVGGPDHVPAPPPLATAPLTGVQMLESENKEKPAHSATAPPSPPTVQRTRPAPRPTADAIPMVTSLSVPPNDPAVLDLVTRLVDGRMSPGQNFHLVVIPENDWPRIESFPKVTELVLAIRGYIGKPVHVFPFLGHHLGITEGDNKFLTTPFGASLPLFDTPEATGSVPHGWMGPALPEPHAGIPQTQPDHDYGEPMAAVEEAEEETSGEEDAPFDVAEAPQ